MAAAKDGRIALMSDGPYDPRAICNLMLDIGEQEGRGVSNLALQKLLYFAHARHLIERRAALVSGYFEAWQFGPVHPTAYNAFKAAGDRAIAFRAAKQDPLTGRTSALVIPGDRDVIHLLKWVMASYGRMTPGRLVDISHAKGAPWDFVVGQARATMAFGLRISDNVILERYKFHKISVGADPLIGEPGEDAPFA
jgi:uncharacterized phage-associated protein